MVHTTENTWEIVPNGMPIASGNFTNIATNNAADGVYTLNGQMVAIGDIIDLAHPENNFDSVLDIDAGGIKCRDDGGGSFLTRQFAINDPLLTTALTDGFTVLCEIDAEEDVSLGISCHDDAFNFDTGGVARNVDPSPQEINVSGTDFGTVRDFANFPTMNAISKFALTVASDRVSGSINGSTAITTSPVGGLDATLANIVFSLSAGANSRLRSFAFYEVVDDADLPTLSAL